MTDRNLIQPGYVCIEIIQILQTQVMAGIQSQSQASCHLGCFHERSHRSFPSFRESRSIGLGIEFYAIRTGFGCIFYHFHVGRHEYGCTDTCIIECIQHLGQELQIVFRVPPRIGGQLRRTIRHQCHLMRFHLQHQVDKFGCGIPFYIELRT